MARTFDLNTRLQGLVGIDRVLDSALQEKLHVFLNTIAQATYNTGVQFVERRLKSTRLDYLQSFNLTFPDHNSAIINLDPKAFHLEDGYAGFSMIRGLLNGPKAKISPKGVVYNTIPFRHKTEKAATNLAEQLMGMEMKEGLRRGKDRLGRPTDLSKIQKSSSGVPLQGNVGRIGGEGLHKNLQGLIKVQKTYDKTTQSQYITFRRVSENTDPNKWFHPGFNGVHAFPEMEKWADREIDRLIQSIVL